MNHQMYEEWALMPDYLSPEELQSLKQHLRECESCRQLSANWTKVEGLLMEAKPVEPAPGFTARFSASLAQRKAKEHKRQVRKFLIILSVIFVIAMAAVSIFYYTSNSPIAIIESAFRTGARMVTIWENIKTFSGFLTRLAPVSIVLPFFIVSSIIIVGLTGVWLATIWKFAWVGGKVR